MAEGEFFVCHRNGLMKMTCNGSDREMKCITSIYNLIELIKYYKFNLYQLLC